MAERPSLSQVSFKQFVQPRQRLESEYFFDNKPELKRKITSIDFEKIVGRKYKHESY